MKTWPPKPEMSISVSENTTDSIKIPTACRSMAFDHGKLEKAVCRRLILRSMPEMVNYGSHPIPEIVLSQNYDSPNGKFKRQIWGVFNSASWIKMCEGNCDNDRHPEMELQLLWR